MEPPTNSTWDKYQALVLSELKRLSDSIEKLDADLSERLKDVEKSMADDRIEINLLKYKSSFWGSIGGGLATLCVYLVDWLSSTK